jgi:hypothetical protein
MKTQQSTTPIDVRRDFTMPEHGAATQVWAAVREELTEQSSVYLADCRISDDVALNAIDAEHTLQLWDLSERRCDK